MISGSQKCMHPWFNLRCNFMLPSVGHTNTALLNWLFPYKFCIASGNLSIHVHRWRMKNSPNSIRDHFWTFTILTKAPFSCRQASITSASLKESRAPLCNFGGGITNFFKNVLVSPKMSNSLLPVLHGLTVFEEAQYSSICRKLTFRFSPTS